MGTDCCARNVRLSLIHISYFCKLFKQCFKVNFSAYLNEYRVNKARQLILDPRLSLKDIGAAVGYSCLLYTSRCV